ncbi:DUF5790 family protein, partial [Halorubrum sp. SD612]|uniref:DUF5790 family protein n=1 Tax=Halorubrum sp. SD612 TaxID=1855863 RepID=UPI001E5EE524
MGQSTFDDDDLFGEAGEETRAEVEEHLAAAREELPDPDAVWQPDADNVLGAPHRLKSAPDAGHAVDSLRSAKKAYALGAPADALAAPAELQDELEDTAPPPAVTQGPPAARPP